MNIAELFVNLGIKGSEKTLGALVQVKSGLKDTASTSLEAKAAILGAMYAVERLFAASGQLGTNLLNFGTMFKTPIKLLQEYQYAAKVAGLANGSLESTFSKLARIGSQAVFEGKLPNFTAQIANKVGLSMKDFEAALTNPEVLFQKLSEYAQAEKDTRVGNSALQAFGLDEDMISRMRMGAFNPDKLAAGAKNTFTDDQIANLDKYREAVDRLEASWSKFIGDFNAKHGLQLVTDLSKVSHSVQEMIEAFERLATMLHLFDQISKSFEGWSYILKGVAASVEIITGSQEKKPTTMLQRLKKKFSSGKPKQLKEGLSTSLKKYHGWLDKNHEETQKLLGPQPKKEEKPKPAPLKFSDSDNGAPVRHQATKVPPGVPTTLPKTVKSVKKPPPAPKTVPSWFMQMMQKLESAFTPVVNGVIGETTSPTQTVPPAALAPSPPPERPQAPAGGASALLPSEGAGAAQKPGGDDLDGRQEEIRHYGRHRKDRPTHDEDFDRRYPPGKPATGFDRSKAVPVPMRHLDVAPSPTAPAASRAAPPMTGTGTGVTTSSATINVEQNFQHEGKEPQLIADSSRRGIREAYRQLAANVQGA